MVTHRPSLFPLAPFSWDVRVGKVAGRLQPSIKHLTRRRPATPDSAANFWAAKLGQDLRRSLRPDQVLLKATPRDVERSWGPQLIPETAGFSVFRPVTGWWLDGGCSRKSDHGISFGAGVPWIKLCWGGMAEVPTRGSPHLTFWPQVQERNRKGEIWGGQSLIWPLDIKILQTHSQASMP